MKAVRSSIGAVCAAEHHDDALAFTRGHPLALSLTADVLTRGDRLTSSRLETEPEVVRLLIEKFVQDVPSRAHRLALHACVSAHATTEPLLAAALDQTDVHDLFEWFGRLSFVESGPYRLFPHDLARDVVYMDFRWRDPDAAFRRDRAPDCLSLRSARPRRRGCSSCASGSIVIYLQRYNSAPAALHGMGRLRHDLRRDCDCRRSRGHPRDDRATRGAVRRPRSRATGWSASPTRFSSRAAWPASSSGSSRTCASTAVTADDLAADPAAGPCRCSCRTARTAATGEHMTYCRFFMHRERYQVAGAGARSRPAASLSWTAPGLAWCFLAVAYPDVMEPMFSELHIWRDPRGRLRGRRPALWRVRARLARRERRAMASPEGRARLAARRTPCQRFNPRWLRPSRSRVHPRRIRS